MDASQNTNFGSPTSGGMVGGTLPNTPIHSGDDIILTGNALEQKPGKKKIALVLGMIGGVIVLVALLLVMMIGQRDGGIEEKYNKYMNYLVYQSDSGNKLEVSDETSLDEYALMKRVKEFNAGETPEYISELLGLWDDLLSSLKTGDETDYVGDISDGLNFLSVYASNYPLEESQNQMFDGGGDIQAIKTNYDEIIARYNGAGSSDSSFYASSLRVYVGELTWMNDDRNSESNKRYRDKMREDMKNYVLSVVETVIGQSFELDWEIRNE